jgi:hypothetical protein
MVVVPHFTVMLKLASTLPVFDTVTVPVTALPAVVVPRGERVTSLIFGIAETMIVVTKLWDAATPVAVTVIAYVPGDVEVVEAIVSEALLAEPDVSLMMTTVAEALELVKNTEGLVAPEGETDAVRVTLPVNPLLVNVRVDVAEPPAMKEPGAARVPVKVKLLIMLIDTSTECRSEPLVPVRVTV